MQRDGTGRGGRPAAAGRPSVRGAAAENAGCRRLSDDQAPDRVSMCADWCSDLRARGVGGRRGLPIRDPVGRRGWHGRRCVRAQPGAVGREPPHRDPRPPLLRCDRPSGAIRGDELRGGRLLPGEGGRSRHRGAAPQVWLQLRAPPPHGLAMVGPEHLLPVRRVVWEDHGSARSGEPGPAGLPHLPAQAERDLRGHQPACGAWVHRGRWLPRYGQDRWHGEGGRVLRAGHDRTAEALREATPDPPQPVHWSALCGRASGRADRDHE